MTINIAYMTSRREPMAQWFFDSLHRECQGDYTGIKLIMVDFWANYPGRRATVAPLFHHPVTHVPPKPTVWQGEFRLTSKDWFAAANARNTALCLSEDGYIVYVDDLSVLVPGWLREVRTAVANNYVACGVYEKVVGLEVAEGIIQGYREFPPGKDTRLSRVFGATPIPCQGQWLYGASVAIPTGALFAINGWDEACDATGLGSEDYICGMMLEKAGATMRLCPGMKTLESEELHHVGVAMERRHPCNELAGHRILGMVAKGRHTAPNYANMRELRQLVLFENQPFPVEQIPQHHWLTGQPLSEL